jgi:hypothetical protein
VTCLITSLSVISRHDGLLVVMRRNGSKFHISRNHTAVHQTT